MKRAQKTTLPGPPPHLDPPEIVVELKKLPVIGLHSRVGSIQNPDIPLRQRLALALPMCPEPFGFDVDFNSRRAFAIVKPTLAKDAAGNQTKKILLALGI